MRGGSAVLRFTDNGSPYDPAQHGEPELGGSEEEREIGGLGIFLVKKTMDRLTYEYADGCNRITAEKKLGGA